MSQLSLEEISKKHKRDEFDCGIDALNNYLKKYARQNSKSDLGKTFVLTIDRKILGFFTISTTSIEWDTHPNKGSYPRYAIPGALIGRLAVDKNEVGNGYGSKLLIGALEKIVNVSDQIAINCIVVDAKGQDAKSFYEKYGFEELLDDDLHLYLSIETARDLFDENKN